MYKYENFIGKVLDSRYKIIELVGLGGMAFVLKAEDLVMNRIVAIKILNDEYNGNEQAEARFINESKAVAMLSHKNIVSIYDVAIYPDMKYIVMEFLDGITLREYLDNKGILPWKEACVYILQILRALEHAHSKGVIHRDIKPQNIILQKNGEIKVTDFGIAKLPNTPSLTLTEKAIGTVYYISPEQASGKETEFYSDIYAVGIMLYEAVTGKLPFTADSPLSVAMKQVSQAPRNPKELVSTLPEGVCQIILKAMQKDPHARFTSAHTMAKAIEWILRNPEVVFLMGSNKDETIKSNPAAVSIDMIDTGEIQNYDENEIAETLGKSANKPLNNKNLKSRKDKKDKKDKTAKEDKPSRTLFPIIMGVAIPFVLVALIIGGIFIFQFINGIINPGSGNDTVVYPDIVNQTWSPQLQSQLANGEYKVKFKIKNFIYVENENYESGKIIAQDPKAGHESVKETNASDDYYYFTSITICKNKEDILVPDVMYLTSTAAKVLLQNDKYKLNVQIQKESNYDFYDGQVIRTEPEIGSIAKAGDTVTIYVCERAASASTLPMPELNGLTEAAAREMIQYTQYTYNFIYVENPEGTGKVTAQSIPAGTVSPVGTAVDITVTIKPAGNKMPDLMGLSASDAIDKMTAAGIELADFRAYYIEKGDDTLRQFISGLEFNQAINKVKDIFEEANITDDTIIVYQSPAAGTEITENTKFYVIYGVQIESN